MRYIHIDGKITTAPDTGIPVDNGSFRYGYGLFETMLVQDGIIRLKEYHWERLFEGAKKLYLDIAPLMTREWLEDAVAELARKNKLEHLCRVRLQLYAPGGGMYGLESTRPGLLIECFPIEESTLQLNENGLIVGIADGLNKAIDNLCNLKSCNALIYAIGARQAKANKWNDALITNTHGNVVESTIANIFWIQNGTIFTPPLSEGCVAGVMRRHIMTRVPVIEKSFSSDELLGADEVFLTNAIKKIRWVHYINNKQYAKSNIKLICESL